ncbi:MAG: hypothetical protein ACLVJ2_10885 [[Ruminococcus] lactaris]|uniref:hypothetical protein n=3 Tax=[Ruminococcus] lactaris TaxID=46228 RepID=UPI0039997B28
MNKKRLQRLGVVCMAAAMVLTTVSFPRAAKAEEGTLTQADASTSTEQEAGKVLMQVKPSVLQENAISNSQQNPTQNKDGLASWAFDEDDHWWHSRWTGTKDSSEDTISSTVRPWIGSGFGQEILLKKVTYEGRADKADQPNANNSIRKYSLYYADMKDPTATPASNDWILAKSGHFTDITGEQEIVLDQAVKATHFKLVGENTNNWQNGDTEWTGSGTGGDGSTCAQNIKVYAEDTLNLTVTAPVEGQALKDVENEVCEETVATVEDTSENPIDTSAAIMNDDGTFGGQIANVDDSKLDALTGTTPFMIRMKVKLNSAATKNHILINRGGEPYQIAYGKDGTASRIKFQMRDTGGTWHETKVCVTDKIGQEIDILALYTGSTMGLWVDGERCTDYSSHNSKPDVSYTMKNGTANALKIGEADSNASIKSVQVVNNIGTITNTANYNTLVIPAFNQGNQLLNLQVVEKKKKKDHQYTLTSKWTKDGVDVTEAANTDGTQNYSAVVTATPTGSLVFTEDSMPQMLKVNVDGTNTKTVPITSADLNSDGTMMVSYSFEDLFIGGSLRMDYADDYSKTCMRFGYDFTLPTGATFEGCEWYYGTAKNALAHILQPQETKYIMNPENKGSNFYRSNIVFTNLESANYENNVYARVLVKYTLNGKSYSKMGSFIDTRTVKEVAESIANSGNASEKQKNYAKGILDIMPK